MILERGYSTEHKGYCCWDPINRQFCICRDVTFDESRSFYSCPSFDVSPGSLTESLFLTLLGATLSSALLLSHLVVPSFSVPSSDYETSPMDPAHETPSSASLLPSSDVSVFSSKPLVIHVYTIVGKSQTPMPSPHSNSSSAIPAPELAHYDLRDY
ncbi:hypothetical protein GUJ93_ZPchr0006g44548 [Zizania palustris]|uniref:Retroviral polymerase SH3-like domain-containing protein n=1 Tax=Zizania palustris TaxID=103762 RepID=A0A8J5TAG7_ZIZPA|nr:hypothetical protein GUJ93_ZPchr0006g44548 [Zizania palustris]